MLFTLTIVLSLAAVAVLTIVAVQTFRHGWSSNGYMHGDSESFFSDFGSTGVSFFDSGDCDRERVTADRTESAANEQNVIDS